MRRQLCILLILSLICLPVAFQHSVEYIHAIAKSKAKFDSSQIDEKTERANAAAAFVDFVGSSAYWFMGGFLFFTAAMNVAYENVTQKWQKSVFGAVTGFVLWLALRSFFYADECAKFLSDDLHGQYFSQIVDVHIGSALLSIFVGRMFFEMMKPIFTKDTAKKREQWSPSE